MNPRRSETVQPIWMVGCSSSFATHWSDPDNTYGPFRSQQEAEEFISKTCTHGYTYDGRKEPWR